MQFITTGNRIAVENFVLGDLYTITFTSGTYINSACIGIGENFVSFQRNEPELLFTLNMETAELVSSIDLYAGGTGTNNYNELSNKPQIGGVELVGNKSLTDLGIQAEITEESPLSSSLVSGLGSAAAAESSDFATAAQGELAASAIQSAGTGLTKDGTTLNHSNSVTAQTSASFSSITFDAQGHITGSTAATTAQLNAINSGITSTDVAQIETNKTNILLNQNKGFLQKNLFENKGTSKTQNYVTFTVNDDKTVSVSTSQAASAQTTLDLSGAYLPNNVKGKYLTGVPSTSTDDNYAYYVAYSSNGTSESTGVVISNGDMPYAMRSDYNYYRLIIIVKNGTNIGSTPVVFKPMITATTDTTYQPYAMSNVELAEKIKVNTDNILSENIITTSFVWSDGYINRNGVINNSTQSQFSQPFILRAGQKITVMTRNTNIGIINTTTAESLSVGDTVTVLKSTSNITQNETYTYTATEDTKISICVLKSIYVAYISTPNTNLQLADYTTAAIMDLQNRVTALENT